MKYIGSRYVPKFMGEYDATTSYEALSVVDNGAGTSYISNKPTPPGIPLTNTSYWTVYGASSGAIYDLQNRMTDAENDIDNIEGDITTINSDIAAIKRDIKGGILVIGNSYVGLSHVADELKDCYDEAYEYHGGGGSGFVAYSMQSNTYGGALNTAISELTTAQKEYVKAIIFVSAMGDSRALAEIGSYASDLETAASNIIMAVSNNFPNCERVCVTLAESRSVASFGTNTWSNLFLLHRIFKRVFARTSMEYIGWSGFNALMVDANFESDHYHPSAIGGVRIGHDIVKQMFGGFQYNTLNASDNIYCNNYSNGSTINVYSSISPDRSILNLKQFIPANEIPTLVANTDLFTTADMTFPVPCYDEILTQLYIERDNETVLKGTASFYRDDAGCMRCKIVNLTIIPSTAVVSNNKFCIPSQIIAE